MGPWLITRPPEDTRRDVATLRERGVEARALPLLERVPLPWQADRPDLVLLSSASVIPALLEVWPGWSPKPRIAAMGPETAARARAAGLPVALEATGGAVALARATLEALRTPGGRQRLLYPTSRDGLHSPEQAAAAAMLAEHLDLSRVAVLDLVPPAGLPARLGEHTEGGRFVLASPSAVRALLTAPWLRPGLLLCHGASTAAALAAALPPGWPAPVLSPAASVVDAVLAEDPSSRLESP